MLKSDFILKMSNISVSSRSKRIFEIGLKETAGLDADKKVISNNVLLCENKLQIFNDDG